MKKGFTREKLCGIVAIVLALLGIVLFALGFSTGYYTYGQMNSGWITAAAIGAVVIECAAIVCLAKFPKAWWPKLLTFAVTAMLAFSALALIGDRVEGIGNCILTDYDSGHGGEEAIYLSLGAAVAWLAAMVFNIIGSFGKDGKMKAPGVCVLPSVGIVLLIAILIPSLILGGVFAPKAAPGGVPANGTPGGSGTEAGDLSAVAGTYTIKLSGSEGNVDVVQDYQFLCANIRGLMNYDTRLTLDLALTLNADGTYALLSDAYCVEAGKRAVIGDDTGLGMVMTLNAEGTYTVNADGTITTSAADHAVFELALDTYSSQMRGPASIDVNGSNEDGKYDSAEYSSVLEACPETVWTLSGSEIVSYGKPAAGAGTYTIRLSGSEGNVDVVQDYQFLCANIRGLMNYDTRLTLDLTLTLNVDGTYALLSDAYCVEAGKRAVIGDDTGLGMVMTLNAEGTYTVNADGTITTSAADHAVFELALDTYSSQMRGPASIDVNGSNEDGKYDSAEYSSVLEACPETVWMLSGSEIKAYAKAGVEKAEEPEPADEPAENPPAEAAEGAVIPSDDGGTEMTFYPDGTYRFWFASYSIEEFGTYTYADGKLTVVNGKGAEATAEGDPLKLHYVSAKSDMLTGDYTIPADTLAFGGADAAEVASAVIPSDDGGTEMTFFSDGTYRFWFASYSIEEFGTYTYADGKLTVVNGKGAEATAEGDPLKLHYVSAKSDMLTGDYTIPADTLTFGGTAAAAFEPFTAASDDGGTELTFNADGTYRFFFPSYNVEESGTYTYADGQLTVVNSKGAEATAEGDPLKLHYVSAMSDMLTGDYTIPADKFGSAAKAAMEPVTYTSADGGTELTLNGDGTYRFYFAAYNVEDLGTYALENGILTVTNANGLVMTIENGVLHYVSSMSDMLTGDFAIDVSQLG